MKANKVLLSHHDACLMHIGIDITDLKDFSANQYKKTP